jgi:subtilisin family serine protease
MQVNRWSGTSWCARHLGPRTAAALLAAASALAAQAAARVDPDLSMRVAREQGQQRLPVIVHLAQQADPAELARAVAAVPQGERGGRLLERLKAYAAPRQAALLKDLAARKAEHVVPLVTVNAVAAHLTAKDVRELAERADVALLRYDIGLLAPSRRLAPDPCHPARPTPRQRIPRHCRDEASPAAAPAVAMAASAAGASFDLALPPGPTPQAVGAPAAWAAGFTGRGVTVAVVDTGVDLSHPDLAGSWRAGAGGWFDVHGEHAVPRDLHGHGTQLAGVLASVGASGRTLGVAPQARWIAARVYNDRNVARLSDLHRVMAWLLDPDGKPGTPDAPQVVLNAWGLGDRPGTCDAEFASDLRWLRAAGMHVVFAAGNGGPMENSSVSPANNDAALAVGALEGGGKPALFSSRGVSACDARPYPDLMAPGELLRTTDLSVAGRATQTLGTGTSFAAAVVAGELALLAQAHPALSPAEREALLRPVANDARPPLLRALALAAPAPAGTAPAAAQ